MPATLLWFDIETFGTHAQWDRIAQFAAIRTDDSFEPVDEPLVLHCRVSADYLPDPGACIVTGITPDVVNEIGISEREFAAEIHTTMMQSGTCSVGYNSLRFDDEFIRALFYRNFYDPYRREYESGNSRWDIIDLARMCHDLRPDGIEWVEDDEGRPSFRLGELTRANGIEHENAHDALADVRATIDLAALIHDRQPKLFTYYYELRKKDAVRRRLNLQRMEPVLHTSRMFSSEKGCTTVVLPLSVHPTKPNVIICYDLRRNPADWLDQPIDELKRRVFSKSEELDDGERIPLKGIHLNRSPAIAPISTLMSDRAVLLGIDLALCRTHADMLTAQSELIQKVRSVFSDPPQRNPYDPELQIYSGDFFPDEDREVFERIRTSTPVELREKPPKLYDPRGNELLWRYIARNFPESLDDEERARWRSFCATRILTPEPDYVIDFGRYMREVTNQIKRVDTPAADKRVLKRLLEYGENLEATILS